MTEEKRLDPEPAAQTAGRDAIYELDGSISVQKAVPFGLQHVLAMFVANIAPILIVAGVVHLSTEETGSLVQTA